LLVDRDYTLCHEKYGTHTVRYAVGQPMGALSSWAMLAVTHHFLVQIAAHRAGLSRPGLWYSNYELLGDDIVIFDASVAHQYLLVMAGIGVPINVSKSVVARNCSFEFAKVTGSYGQNVSAISWKMFMSQASLMGRVNIVFSLIQKGIISSFPIRQIRHILKPNQFHPSSDSVDSFSIVALLAMFANSGAISYEILLKALLSGETTGRLLYKNVLNAVRKDYMEGLLGKIIAGVPLTPQSDPRVNAAWMMDVISLKRPITRRVTAFLQRLVAVEKRQLKVLTDPQQLVVDMLRALVPALGDSFSDSALSCTTWTNFDLPEGSAEEAIYYLKRTLTNSLQRKLGRISVSLGKTLTGFKKPSEILPLEEVLLMAETLDRYQELQALVPRSRAKVLQEKTRVLKDSPLAPIKFIVRSSLGRRRDTSFSLKVK